MLRESEILPCINTLNNKGVQVQLLYVCMSIYVYMDFHSRLVIFKEIEREREIGRRAPSLYEKVSIVDWVVCFCVKNYADQIMIFDASSVSFSMSPLFGCCI